MHVKYLPLLQTLLIVAVLWLVMGGSPARAQSSAQLTRAQCEGLVGVDFARVEDAPSEVLSANLVMGAGSLPSYCEILGRTWRDVRFRVRLPMAGWNGKLVVFGTGGQAGDFFPDDPALPVSTSGSALRQGYATATHNGGHVSAMTDASWALENEPALLDYGFRAPHVTGLIARAVVGHIYGRQARLVYYSGCSNGGREALQLAQHYPTDYDGIIAGAPSMRWSELFAHLHWFANRLYGDRAVLDRNALAILHRFVLDRCDELDGVRDGILEVPRECQVDVGQIICSGRSTRNCLTAEQAQAAREIYDGPHDREGRRVTYSSAMPGSELVWDDFDGIESYPQSVFRYQSLMPAPAEAFVVDEARLNEYIRRSGGSDAILSADNPDLRRFRDNGGRLLSYMGWNDPIGGVRETIDYYATVERVIGGREATQGFYRLFMVPGMNHCTGGDGAYQIDWLNALDAWVDGQQAPLSITGYRPAANGEPAFFRNVSPLLIGSEPSTQEASQPSRDALGDR